MDNFISVSFLLCLAGSTIVNSQHSQSYQTTTAVPILKQIDRHNEDGSYSYGYEAADGSFKIESKYPTGEVYGKYGYIDDTGKVREIEYGASQRGFEPAGTDINVPPSTLQGNTVAGPNDPEDDGQYREDPSVYHTDPKYTNGEYYRPTPKRPAQSNYNQIPAANYDSSRQRYNPPASVYNPSASTARTESQYQPTYQQQYQQPQYQQEYQSPVDQIQYQQSPRYPNARAVYESQEPLYRQDVDARAYSTGYYGQ